ncbi:MAG TPA: hypothetical protein VFG86_22925 [Chloroflexota bacterium]|nr:hypothetical protein [Chloroflexota bacterium]
MDIQTWRDYNSAAGPLPWFRHKSPARFQRQGASMFIQRITLSPAMGKGRELRALVEDRVKKGQAQGQRISLASPVFGDDMGSLVLTIRFNDMAELEKSRARNAADKDFQEYVGKVSSMAASRFELLEVLVPFQSP